MSGFRYEMLPVEIDEPLMRDIASKTGGRYFRATDTESLVRRKQEGRSPGLVEQKRGERLAVIRA